MESLILELPALYADHHVIEVRRILLELPGVGDVYASSAFQTVEIEYDPDRLQPAVIENALRSAGYLGALATPEEVGAGLDEEAARPFFRRAISYAQVGKTVSFTQEVTVDGNSGWPCPGLGLIQKEESEHAA